MNKSFQFKQFTVNQDQCAMKIGTDGVLLGAWASINNPFSVLDIGAGTGVIALMIAQRCNAKQIDAVEIQEDAYEQCVENFENSPWADRLFCYHASINEFTEEMKEEKYDLILSNPPYFVPNIKEIHISESRKKARFKDSLPFEDLIKFSSQLLSKEGQLAIIIPFSEEKKVLKIAENFNFFPNHITRVRGTKESSIKRSLLQFSLSETILKENELVLEIRRHNYTEDYKKLVENFYLKL
ncbi:MAG: tRNA (adenine-N(6)-)-methyltransferase [Bacteroidetes bacterium HGW-Bacteroidetes-2]|jgi:tRNA1Val (adenine37-N6)-methyltransferase|nr:MAG: tRNA (adenine-N(6)-)-methyltransferase [Bacteroidetes bacterium HGW-Bacteroidetes-2]